MKTLLIDPFNQTITEVEYNGQLDGMYALLQCDIVEAVTYTSTGKLFPTDDCLFVDEEGLFKGTRFFEIDGQTIAGRAMTVGVDDEGNTIEAKVSIADIESRIHWL